MKNLILALSVLVLSACGGEGAKSGDVALPANGTPNLRQPLEPDGGDTAVSLTYYTLSKTEAPVNGWAYKTITTSGSCVQYNTSVYCWDDGVKTLSWSYNSQFYGPYTYTHFQFASFNGVVSTQCHGGCGDDLMLTPRLINSTLVTYLGQSNINDVFTNGVAKTVSCVESSGTLSCGDFAIDLNQAAL